MLVGHKPAIFSFESNVAAPQSRYLWVRIARRVRLYSRCSPISVWFLTASSFEIDQPVKCSTRALEFGVGPQTMGFEPTTPSKLAVWGSWAAIWPIIP